MTEDYTYEELLKEICEEVYCFKEFGTYQGDWWAKVKYKGKKVWIHGWFGSCSGCDWILGRYCREYSRDEIKESFICDYLEDGMFFSQEEAEKEALKDIEWDLEAQDLLDFIKKYREM